MRSGMARGVGWRLRHLAAEEVAWALWRTWMRLAGPLTGWRLAGILHVTIAQGQSRRHHGPFTSTQVTVLRDLGSPGLSLRKALLVIWG